MLASNARKYERKEAAMTRFLVAMTLIALSVPAIAETPAPVATPGACASEADIATLVIDAGMSPVLRVHGKSGKPYLLGIGADGGGLLVGQDGDGCYRLVMPIPEAAVKAIRTVPGEPV
jgi:hypothetical protein